MEELLRRCRICLQPEGSRKGMSMSPIFETSNISVDIFLCTQIKIVERENTPALICGNCSSDLKVAVKFRANAVKGDKYFRELTLDIDAAIKGEHTGAEIKSEPPNCNDDDEYDLMQNIEMLEFINDDDDDGDEKFDSVEIYSGDVAAEERRRMKRIRYESEPIEQCEHCKKSFKKSYMRKHTQRAHPDLTNARKKAKKSFSNEDGSLFCKICKKLYTSQNSLRKHMKVKHEFVDVKQCFECDHCGRLFKVKEYIQRHMKDRHLNGRKRKKANEDTDSAIPCDQCGKILRNRGLLKSHMRCHQLMTPNDYWYCDLCPRKFKTKGGCSWHIQQRHVLKATFKCPYDNCAVVYKGKWELKMHIKSKHTDVRDYRCEICGKGFCDKQKLQIHTRIHTNERPHACTICTATFIHQTDLRRHIWGHTGYRPYKCEVLNCGRGFMKKSELLNHSNRCHSTPYSSNFTM